MKNYFHIICNLLLGSIALGQSLPMEIPQGNVKMIRDSVTTIDNNLLNSWQRFHDNDYHHYNSSQRVDSLFHRQWLLTATSPYRQSVTTYDRDKSVLHREWYDHVLEYKFKENFVYYEKDVLQFYEVKNVPFVHTIKTSNDEIKPFLRFSNDYNRKAYFEYNDSNDMTFEMSQDDFFQMGKFYHEYDLNGRPSLIKYFQNGQWLWSEDHEYEGENTSLTFLFLNVKRFPFLIEKETRVPEDHIVELEYSTIPKGSLYKRPRSKKVIQKDKNGFVLGNEYWFNLPVSMFEYEFKKKLSNQSTDKKNQLTKSTSLEEQKTFTDSVIKDAQGRMIEFNSYSDLYNTILEKYLFTYNERGDIIEIKSFQYDLSNRVPVESVITIAYTYDSTGNWTQQIKSINGKPTFKWDRKITYYNDSVTSR
ncbi:MAG: hypothetical protein ACSHWW_02625 [Nonlabens sp.]|uniref:hypothetical protein n=1 Tax=Nonlabens sp. TaxID=1888209 RepID=UPI003EF4336D